MFEPKRKYVYFSFLCLIPLIGYLLKPPKNPLVGLNAEELIRAFGYPLEVHQVETEDGYLLTLHRIPRGFDAKKNNGVPVLLMHGVFQTSADFVASGRGKALGLLLADWGFDVWIGNTRGSFWSRRHVELDPDQDAEFWNYTLHEISVFDITAKIDHILSTTKQSNLHYIGYSQGVSQYFIALSERPEYNKKIRLMSALAPPIFVDNLENFAIRNLALSVNILQKYFEYTGIVEVFSPKGLMSSLLKMLCNGNYLLIYFCMFHFKVLQGGIDQIDTSLLPVITSNMPDSVSSKQFVHSLQVGQQGYLQHFDYGNEMNLKVYGQENPIQYEFHNLTAPISIYYSKNDQIVNIKNIKGLNQVLPNVVKNYLIPMENFYHMDFLMGKDACKVLYYSVIEEMMKF